MPSENEQVVARFYEAFVPGNMQRFDEVLDTDWVDHTLPAERAPGVDGMKRALGLLLTLVPDLKLTVVQMISSGDMVAVHLVFTGTHGGSLFGQPATGAPIRFIAFDHHRVVEGRIVESWHLEDNLELFQQVGWVPRMG